MHNIFTLAFFHSQHSMAINTAPSGHIVKHARVGADHTKFVSCGHSFRAVVRTKNERGAQQAAHIKLFHNDASCAAGAGGMSGLCSPTCHCGSIWSGRMGATVISRTTPLGSRNATTTSSAVRP